MKSTPETVDSRIIKYFDQNGKINEESMSGADIPCSILESVLESGFEQINKPLVAQFLMVCSSKCDEDEDFLNELRDTFFIGLEDENTQNISNIIRDAYLGTGSLSLISSVTEWISLDNSTSLYRSIYSHVDEFLSAESSGN